jgi:uncharacterized protein (TIGR02270 family)
MATSPHDFAVRMYEEHLEDASFLYTQIRALRNDAELPWTRLADFEERLEAHLDALVIGTRLALEVCERRAKEGDAGEMFAAVSVFCRHGDARLLAETWRALDYDDSPKTRAVTDALKYELPEAWYPNIQRAIERGDPRQVPLLAVVCGFRRLPGGQQLVRRAAADGAVSAELVRALSRVPDCEHKESLLAQSCAHADSAIRSEAYLGLLRSGRRDALLTVSSAATQEVWPQMLLGLGGDRAAAGQLRRRLEAGAATPDTLLALGLLGDLTTVRSMTRVLDSEELGPGAAEALHWITGAPLFEDVFVPEEIDAASLFDAELRAWRERRQLPRRVDGQPFGTTVHLPVRDAEVWNNWLATHAARFNPDYRYRRGQPYSARAVLHCILDETVPNRLRQLAYEELCIRFGCDIPFDTELPVRKQTVALRAIAEWLAAREAQLQTGRW